MSSTKVEHSLSVLAMFKEMKRRRFICDFALEIGKEKIPVHRAILAASSDYFVRLFSSGPETAESVSELRSLDPSAFRICIDFIYGGTAIVTLQNVRGVLHAASTLQLHRLIKICVDFLEESVSIKTCLYIRSIAKENNFLHLLRASEGFAAQNFDLILRSSGFQTLSDHQVVDFMARTSNNAKRWEAAIAWINGDATGRLCHLADMLKWIISHGCSFGFLYDILWIDALVGNSLESSSIVAEAMFTAITSSNINESNCFDLLQIAWTYEEQCPPEVLQQIRDFVAANFDTASHTDEFMALDEVDLFGILKSQNAEYHSPESKWEAAVSWVKNDLQRRKENLYEIMKTIDWVECPFEYFFSYVYGDGLVKKLTECSSYAASVLLGIMRNTDIRRQNWYSLLGIAKRHQDTWSQKAHDKILEFAAVNFTDVSMRNAFGKLDKEDVLILFESPAVKAVPEEVKWEAILRWVKRDVQKRKEDMLDFLKTLDLDTWRFEFLYNRVYVEEILKGSDDCREHVISALLSILQEEDIKICDCFPLLSLAREHETRFSEQAIGRIKTFLVKNYGEISKFPEFLDLEVTDIFSILDSQDFVRYDEDQKWTPIFSWVLKHDSRSENLVDVLVKLNLESFSFRFLDTKVLSQVLVQMVTGCKELCVSAMLSNLKYQDINLVNWFELFQLAKDTDHQNTNDIVAKIKQFMAANFAQIHKHAHFGKLEKEEILFMLNSPEIANSPPEEQLQGAMEWIKADLDARADDAIDIFKSLKLEGFPFTLLFGTLLSETVVAESPDCTELFLKSIQSALKPNDVNAENWRRLLGTAKENGPSKYGKITQLVHQFIAIKFAVLLRQNCLIDLSIQDFHDVLRSSNLRVSEELKAQAIMGWVKTDESKRHLELTNLLRLVKLEKLPKVYLKDTIFSDPIVKKSEECKDMMLEALFSESGKEGNSDVRSQTYSRSHAETNGQ